MSDVFLNALKCKNHDRPPVWLMRQAGRALPSYRKIREKISIEELFHQPDLAAQITLLPVQELDVDAAILFTDILILAEAFGFRVCFVEGRGPVIEPRLTTPEDIEKLEVREISSSLSFVFETIRIAKKNLKVPLIGFCGGPFTVASYLLEGGSGGKELAKTKAWMYTHPESFHLLLKKITQASIEYLKLQIQAGVQVLQIFDSWAHVLSTPFFLSFCLNYLNQIVHALKETNIPVIVFCRGSSFFAQELVTLEPHAISFDWHKELHTLRKKVPSHIAIQGNLDPHLLRGPKALVQSETERLIHSMNKDPGFIVNLGHGVLPDTPLENLHSLIQTVKS
jgi:uroporphyrinogen decarboxylase